MMIAAALAALCAACGGRDAEVPRGAWPEGQAWRLEEVVRIGSADGGGPDEFAWIADVELDAMGRVWVADGQQHQIRVFDSAGTHVRSIGRRGGGPEEFNGIAGMSWAPDGTLWVLDGGNARFAVYDTAGKLVATHRRSVNVTVAPWPLGFDTQGRFYDLAPVKQSGEPSGIVRFGPGMVAEDTFRVPAYEQQYFELRSESGGNHTINQVNVPFTPQQEWALDPAGNPWVAVTDRYRLERRRFDGTVEQVIEGTATARRVTREDRDRAIRGYGDFTSKGGKIDASRIPDTHQLLEDFFFGEDGTVWVKLATGRDEPAALDVFDRAAVYLGRVQAPTLIGTSPAPAFRGGRMAAVVTDEDGVASVLLMRVEKPGS